MRNNPFNRRNIAGFTIATTAAIGLTACSDITPNPAPSTTYTQRKIENIRLITRKDEKNKGGLNQITMFAEITWNTGTKKSYDIHADCENNHNIGNPDLSVHRDLEVLPINLPSDYESPEYVQLDDPACTDHVAKGADDAAAALKLLQTSYNN